MTKRFAAYCFPIALGVTLGLAGTALVSAQTAAPKITATGGWNLCTDWAVPTMADALGLSLRLAVDGGVAARPTGVTWAGTVSPFTSQIPLAQLPAAAQTVGLHAFSLYATVPTTILLADGTTLTATSSLPLTGQYEIVVAPVAPTPTNPRWIRIVGTIAAILLGVWFWRTHV